MVDDSVTNRVSYWRNLLSKQRESNLSIKAFCRDHRVSEASFYTWRKRLDAKETRSLGSEPNPPFVAVSLPATSTTVDDFGVRLPNGIVISVPREFDAAALQHLVQAIMECGRA